MREVGTWTSDDTMDLVRTNLVQDAHTTLLSYTIATTIHGYPIGLQVVNWATFKAPVLLSFEFRYLRLFGLLLK